MSSADNMANVVLDVKHELKIPGNPRSMWLLKIPSKDTAAAIDAALDNEEIGCLKRHKDTISSGPPSKRLKYDIEIDNTFATRYEETKKLKTPLFKNFKLQFQDQMPTVSIFSETTEKPAGAVENVEYEGVIGAEATMTNDLAFASNMTNRFISKTTVANTREKAQETEDLKTAFNPRGKDALASSNEASKKGKEKRTRENVTDDEIKARIFALFKDYDYIRLKDIVAKLNLPEGPVRRILIKIADLVKEIEHRNTWRLKAQFRSN